MVRCRFLPTIELLLSRLLVAEFDCAQLDDTGVPLIDDDEVLGVDVASPDHV